MKGLQKVFLVFFLFILFLFGILILLFTTSTGLNLILHNVTRWIPGLEISSVHGSFRNFILKEVHYKIPGMTINAGECHLSLHMEESLRSHHLYIHHLSLRNLSVEVQSSDLDLTTGVQPVVGKVDSLIPIPPISLPYSMILHRLLLSNVHIKVDNTVIAFKECSSGFTFRDNALIVTSTRIFGIKVECPTKKVANKIGDHKIIPIATLNTTDTTLPQNRTHDDHRNRDIDDLSMMGRMVRTWFGKSIPFHLFTLPFNITLERVEGEDLHLIIQYRDVLIQQFNMQAATFKQHIELTSLNIESPQWLLNAYGNAQFIGQCPMNLTMNFQWNRYPLKGETIQITMVGKLLGNLRTDISCLGPITGRLFLQTRLSQTSPMVLLMLDSDGMQWSLTAGGVTRYQVTGIALRLESEARGEYRMTLKAAFHGDGMPTVDIAMELYGNTEGFTLSHLRLKALKGYTDLKAVVNWENHPISWSSELILNGINTADQWPECPPIRLVGKIITCGNFYGRSHWQLQIPEWNIIGNIERNEFTARGSFSGNSSGQWTMPEFLLEMGPNTLKVNGNLQENFSIDAILHFPELHRLWPSLSGSVQGSLKLRGGLRTPKVIADFNAHSLQWTNIRIQKIALKSKIQHSAFIRGDIQLQLDQWQKGSLLLFNQLIFTGTGDERDHQLMLTMQGPVSGQLHINGGFDRSDRRWYGTLRKPCCSSTIFLRKWNVMEDMGPLLYSQHMKRNILIASHDFCCHTHLNTVVQKNFYRAIHPPIVLIPEYTKNNSLLLSRYIIDRELESRPSLRPTHGHNRVKIQKIIQGIMVSIEFETITLNVKLDNNQACFNWLIQFPEKGQCNGQIQIEDLQNYRNISGKVKVNNLSLFNILLSYSNNIDSLINADFRMSGSVSHPQFYGKLKVEHLVMRGSFIPFVITDSQLSLHFTGNSSGLQGVINTPHGTVNLSGNMHWGRIEEEPWWWHVQIHARGQKVRMTIPSIGRIDISPDIICEATPTLLSLNGNIDIPWGRIEITDLEKSVVRLSYDEILLDEELHPLSNNVKNMTMPIKTNVFIHVGDDVRIDAFGLKANLKGDLRMIQDKQGFMGLNGQIDIFSGRFHALGQELIVNKGQLWFSGPIDRPYLHIEAIRNPDSTADNVTAGIWMTGLVDQLKIQIFSDPIKSQQEALFYLLYGQGMQGACYHSDTNIIPSILMGMGIAKSGKIIGKIGEIFGVSHLELDTQGIGENSQVVVRGCIGSHLQIKYGVGIFDSLVTLSLRYRLMPKLYLKVVSAQEQMIDLLYRFEF